MRFFWTGTGILLVCLCLCFAVTEKLDSCAAQATSHLEQAQAFGENKDYDQAARWVRRAMAEWEAQRSFFGMTLRHDEIDDVNSAFRTLIVYAERGTDEEFAPACAGILEQIRHISNMEKPYYYNIL